MRNALGHGLRAALGLGLRAALLAGGVVAGSGVALAQVPPIVANVCSACHGEGGQSVVPMFPRLAGLQATYIEKQLNDYLSGKRKNEVMAPALEQLKADDVPAVAAYYAAQKPQPGTVQDAKLAAAGKPLFDDGNTTTGVPACSGCHQPGGVGNDRYPRLAGQFPAYTALQMTLFKNGGRTNDRARVMRAVAERMSEQEITAVAEYLAGL